MGSAAASRGVLALANIAAKKLNGHTIIRIVALLAGLSCSSQPCLAFPEMARHGYASCLACHVSPTGGGALTAYGRMTSATHLSTWGSETSAQPFYGASLPSELALGGDARLLRIIESDAQRPPTFVTIPMQLDAELAVTPVQPFTVAASWGIYGEDHAEASRRHYVLARIGEHVTARAGRFFPAYGILTADHSTYARKALGFDEGKETINAELAGHFSFGDAFATAIYGQDATFSANHRSGYDTDSQDQTGAAVRVQTFIGDQTIVGASCLYLESYDQDRRACGLHAITPFTRWLFATVDASRIFTENDFAASGQLTAELIRGCLLGLQGEAMAEKRRAGISLQWFPFPHWELLLVGRREQTEAGDTYTGLGMVHTYL